MYKNAIIVVSFGTSYECACRKGILPIENAVKSHYKSFRVVRAFTSCTIRSKIKALDGVHVDSPAEAIERMMRSGYTNIIVQPTLIIPGVEYEKLEATVEEYRGLSREISIALGKPLLHSKEDFDALTECFTSHFADIESGSAMIMIGHGTTHFANSIYFRLISNLSKMTDKVYFAVVEGEPSFSDVVDEVVRKGIRKVLLKPFMIVAGEHMINDILSDSDGSLKSMLAKQGVESEPLLSGIGGCEAVQQIFINHIEECIGDEVIV